MDDILKIINDHWEKNGPLDLEEKEVLVLNDAVIILHKEENGNLNISVIAGEPTYIDASLDLLEK